MSFGNAIFVTLFFALNVVGISGTICGHGEEERMTYSLADVPHTHPLRLFDSSPEWYRKGMQFCAYTLHGKKWKKRHLSWSIVNDSRVLDRQTVLAAAKRAFAQWSAACSMSFTGPVPVPQADIQIKFVPILERRRLARTDLANSKILDNSVAQILISDYGNWHGLDPSESRVNIRYALLHEVGHVLGLHQSDVSSAVMCTRQDRVKLQYDYDLRQDDINGVQFLYGPPSSSTNRSEPPSSSTNRSQPPSSRPSQPPSNPWGRFQPPSSRPFQPSSNPWNRHESAPSQSSSSQSSSSTSTSSQSSSSTSSSSQSSSSTSSSSQSSSSTESTSSSSG